MAVNLYDITTLSPSITKDEVCKTISGIRAGIMEGTLAMAYNDLYKTIPNPCLPSNALGVHCLLLYWYALENFSFTESNFLTEVQLNAILVLSEQISKKCCCNG